jgi:hypothetical protein
MNALMKVLTFRLSAEDFERLRVRDLMLGLACTWIVGMGRYWDDPTAVLAQKLGLGSLVYVLFLAAGLWILIAPLKPKNWTYRRVLTFVTLTSPPAILYALPVERWWGNEVAFQLNVTFLGVVALWRITMTLFMLPRCANVSWWGTTSATLWPISLAAYIFAANQLIISMVGIMGGLRDDTVRLSNQPWLEVMSRAGWVGLVSFIVYLGAIAARSRKSSATSLPPASCPIPGSTLSAGRSPESKELRSSESVSPPPA